MLDHALDSAEVLADEREDEALDAEHGDDERAEQERAGEVVVRDPVDDAVDAERERRRASRAMPRRMPAVWIGCGQKPASTCSASRVRRSGE